MAFRNFDQEKKDDVRQAGRSAWAEASNSQHEGIVAAGRKAWDDADDKEKERWKEIGRKTWHDLDKEMRLAVLAGKEAAKVEQDKGRDKQILARIDGALKKYDTPGLIVLNPKIDVWKCNGMVNGCDGQCFPVV